jgi:hypothetical protein
MTVHRCAVLLSFLCACVLFACLLVGVFAIVDIAVGQLLGVFVCVWNAASKNHAPDRAFVMFEGLLILCFIWFHFILL